MPRRPCLDNCGALAEPGQGRCAGCGRRRDRARGTRQQRGYDADHDRTRATWAPRVAAGTVDCARCGQPIAPGQPWDLGHHDHDRAVYTGPEHAACNRATNTPGRRSRL